MKLKNNTGSTSKIGYIAKADPKEPNAFIYATSSDSFVLGVITEAVPYRASATIVNTGNAEVFISGNVRQGDTVRLLKNSDNISVGSCIRAKSTDAPILRIGTALKSGNGLTTCSLSITYTGVESGYVPYSGATSDVNLGTKDITATDVNATNVYSTTGRFGGETNNVLIGANGELSFSGTATRWEDENIGSVSLGVGASPPDLIVLGGGGNTILVRAFDGNATSEQMFGEIEIPHKTKYPSDIFFHLHWSPTTTAAGNVKWNLTYILQGDAETLPAEITISVVSAANGTAWKMQMSTFPAITVSGIGKQLAFRLWRNPADVADTYGADAAVQGSIGIHFEMDSVGSKEITTK